METPKDIVQDKLITAGLRPTRQRLLIGQWVFSGPDKHFTAEDLHKYMMDSDETVSLATIYNTLGVFTQAGILKTVNVEAGRVFYDTNTGPHYHLYDETGQHLTDVDVGNFEVVKMPELLKGQVVDRIDVIIRTRSE